MFEIVNDGIIDTEEQLMELTKQYGQIVIPNRELSAGLRTRVADLFFRRNTCQDSAHRGAADLEPAGDRGFACASPI